MGIIIEKSFELSVNTDNRQIYERMFGFLLTNAKKRAINPHN